MPRRPYRDFGDAELEALRLTLCRRPVASDDLARARALRAIAIEQALRGEAARDRALRSPRRAA